MNKNQSCEWLHHILENLPMIWFPYPSSMVPPNGIYFQYERGETFGSEGHLLRIVHVGNHRGDGNLPNRLLEHFEPKPNWMNISLDRPKPSDRSVFRKHIGRAVLNQARDPYLEVWNIDFTERVNRELYRNLRDIPKELAVENRITDWIQTRIGFRFLLIDERKERDSLEASCIGSLAYGKLPSANWSGRYSPIEVIRESGLWQVQHVNGPGLNNADMRLIESMIEKTINWLNLFRK